MSISCLIEKRVLIRKSCKHELPMAQVILNIGTSVLRKPVFISTNKFQALSHGTCFLNLQYAVIRSEYLVSKKCYTLKKQEESRSYQLIKISTHYVSLDQHYFRHRMLLGDSKAPYR